MAKKTRRFFIVGLFVTVGFLIAVGAVIWISASKYFQAGKTYVTFFGESVQGLNKDSEVKYQGVKVGIVDKIAIAPDNKTVAVYMTINLENDLTQKVVAQLTMTGITGLMFVNLQPRKPGAPDLSPKIEFATEYPVIPSKPSEISQILSGIKEAVDELKRADIDGTIKEIKAAFTGISNVVNSKEVKGILAKTDSAAGYLNNSLKRINKTIASGKVNTVLAKAQDAFKDAASLMKGVNSTVSQSQIPQTIKKARLTLDEARALLENLRHTSENLDQLINRLYAQPSSIFFGKPPKPRWNEKSGKARR
jgi:phospholipid/cholesterol/gamma-HCH transport system substrate-binding protein